MTDLAAQPNRRRFVVFADESGDHSLTSIDKQFPVFAMCLCIFEQADYVHHVTPAIRNLKFDLFGHDLVVLHETDIKRLRGAFAPISHHARARFIEGFDHMLLGSSVRIIGVVIDKRRLAQKYLRPAHPYHLALRFGLERVQRFVRSEAPAQSRVPIIAEARGNREDAQLRDAFDLICGDSSYVQASPGLELHVVDKKVNVEGLQVADLTARPIALSVIRPEQRNKAFETIQRRLLADEFGNVAGVGLKVFP